MGGGGGGGRGLIPQWNEQLIFLYEFQMKLN